MRGVFAGAYIALVVVAIFLVGLLVGGRSPESHLLRPLDSKPALTIYVQNFDPSFVRDSTIKADIPVWEAAANGAFRRVWDTPRVRLVFVPAGQSVPRGAEVLQFTANGPVFGAAAYHTQNDGRAAIVVYAGVDDAYGVSLSVATTHELFERLADGTTSFINQGYPVDNFTVSHGQFQSPKLVPVPTGQLLINEVCDPVEQAHYVLHDAQGRPVWISDWVTKNYFNDQQNPTAGVPEYDYLGLVQAPLEVLPGGYQAVYVIDYVVHEGSIAFLYTGWIDFTNFRKASDRAFLAGEHGRVVPFSKVDARAARGR